jgi:hypothetical protein
VFKDDWGTPLQFYRWSTANADLDAAVPASQGKFRNNLDPENTLLNAGWYNGMNYQGRNTKLSRILFENSCYSLSNPVGSNKPYAWYITPVLVSSGPNTRLGLDVQTMAVTSAADANDNLYSYQVKRE